MPRPIGSKNKTIKSFVRNCLICNKEFSVYPYRAKTQFYCSTKCSAQNRIFTDETKRKLSIAQQKQKAVHFKIGHISWNKGKQGIMTAWNKGLNGYRSGSNHHWWKGGISKSYKLGYTTQQYKEWRQSVFIRDNFTCQKCKKRNCYLTAHHIKSWKNYPNLRFSLENGLTLCQKCHSETDNYKYKARMNKLI